MTNLTRCLAAAVVAVSMMAANAAEAKLKRITIGCVVAGALIGQMVIVAGKGVIGIVGAVGLLVGALMTGSATLWIGPETLLALAGAGTVVLYLLRTGRKKKALRLQKA